MSIFSVFEFIVVDVNQADMVRNRHYYKFNNNFLKCYSNVLMVN